jgi:hypothetical protein
MHLWYNHRSMSQKHVAMPQERKKSPQSYTYWLVSGIGARSATI